MAGLRTWLEIDPDRAVRALRKIDSAQERTGQGFSRMEKLASGVFAGFSAGVVLNELRKIAGAVIETGKQFETFGVLLDVHFGGAAKEVFADIKEFALLSPGQVSGITAAWIGLQSVGVTPTIELMRELDNVASSAVNAATGQTRDLADLAEAIRKAVTGETESLKAFNIVARLKGEEITLAYKDTQRTVTRTAEAVTNAVRQIGRENFAGAAVAQMETLAGAASNLEDAWELMASAIFDAGVDDLLTKATRAAEAWVNVIKPGAVAATSDFTKALNGLHDTVLRNLKEGMGSPLFRLGIETVLTNFLGAPLAIKMVTDHLSGLRSIAVKAGADIRKEMDAEAAKGDWLSAHLDALDKQRAESAKRLLETEKKAAAERQKLAEKEIEAFHQLALARMRLNEIPLPETISARETTVSAGRLSPVTGVATTVEEAIGGALIRVGDELEDQYGATFTVVSREFELTMKEKIADVGQFLAENWQAVTADALDILLSGIKSGDIGGALGDIGGMFGGIAGGIFGGPLGEVIGGELGNIAGDLVGDLLGFGAKLETAYSTLIAEGGALVVNVQKGGGQAAGMVDDLVSGVLDAANSIVGSLGGAVEGLFSGFSVQVAVKDGEVREIKAWVDDVANVFETVDEAVAFLIAEILGASKITGLEPEIEAALADAAGKPLEEIQRTVDAAIRVSSARMGQHAAEVSATAAGIVEDFFTVLGTGGDPTAGTIARFQAQRDSILGVTLSQEQIFEQQKKQFNLELDLAELRLLQELSALEAEGQIVQQEVELTRLDLEAKGQFVQGLAGVVGATANAARQLEIIHNALAQIADLRITALDIPEFRGGRGGGRIDTGAASREAAREAERRRQEALAAELAMLEAVAAQDEERIAALEREAQIAELIAKGVEPEDVQHWLDLEEQIRANEEAARALAEAEAEAARQAEEAAHQLENVFGQIEGIAGGPGGIAGQIQAALDALADLFESLPAPEDIPKEEFAALTEGINDAIDATRETITNLATSGLLSILETQLGRAIAAETDPERRLELERELHEVQMAQLEIERAATLIQISLWEEQLRSLGLWTAELEAASDRIGELLASPLPDFEETVVEAGRGFASAVATATGGLPLLFPDLFPVTSPGGNQTAIALALERLLADLGLTAATAADPIALLQAEIERLEPFLAAFGLNIEDLNAALEALRADALSGLRDMLKDLTTGPGSHLSPLAQLEAAQAELDEAFAAATANPSQQTADALQAAAERVLGLTDTVFGQGSVPGAGGAEAIRQDVIEMLRAITGVGADGRSPALEAAQDTVFLLDKHGTDHTILLDGILTELQRRPANDPDVDMAA